MDENPMLTHCDDNSCRVELIEKLNENMSWRNVTKRRASDNPFDFHLNLCCDPVNKDSLSRPYTALNKRENHRLEIKERQLAKSFQKQMLARSHESRKIRQRLAELEHVERHLSCRKQYHQQNPKESLMINSKHVKSVNVLPDTDNVYQQNTFNRHGNGNCLKSKEKSLTAVTLNARAENASQSYKHSGDWIAVKAQPRNSLHIRPPTTVQPVNTYTAAVSGTRRETMSSNASHTPKCFVVDTHSGEKQTIVNCLNSEENGLVDHASMRLGKLSLTENKSMNSGDGQQLLTVSIPFIDGVEEDAFTGEMRPRARTIPSAERRPQPLTLPEIKVEDFSEKLNSFDQENCDEEMFQLSACPPRRRAFTCPDDMFRRRKPTRPATPPPFVPNARKMKGKNKFTFQRKKLFQVAEDKGEAFSATIQESPCLKAASKNISSKNVGIIESPDSNLESASRPTNGYLFTGARKYISRSSCGIGAKRQGTNNSLMSMHRAHSIADGELTGGRAWRSIGTELTS